MFNAIGNRIYVSKVQADVGAQFDQEVDGILNVSLTRQKFINSVVTAVPIESFEIAKKSEVKIFYSSLIALASYLSEVMKGNIAPNNHIEASVCICLLNRVKRVNLDLVSEHERVMIDSALKTLESFQTIENSANSSSFSKTRGGSTAVPGIIDLQISIAKKDNRIFFQDKYALGYLFGMSDMAYYQSGGDLEEQQKALTYIRDTFLGVVEDDGEKLLQLALQAQDNSLFKSGCEVGSNDFSDWLKSQGEFKPLGLANYIEHTNKQLEVGEIDGEYIGCYLFGIEGDDESPHSYHSVATDLNTLILDCREFFESLAEKKQELVTSYPALVKHKQDLKVITNAINNLDMFVNMHLKTNSTEPFLNVAGLRIFLTIGKRKRQKANGKYIE